MSVIYIAGPMTGLPDYNYPAFMAAAEMLSAKYPEAVIINPADNFECATDLPYPTYIRRSFEQVLVSTELYVLAGWNASKGARAEIAMAGLLDLVIVFENGLKPEDERKIVPPVDVPALINALKYAEDGIAKMAEHCDMEAVEAMGLDVQDCRDCVGFAIERAGGVI
tara:strand:- start:199 stop:699 length:501 start_codon:yes stop_codon:yes gene_type:complete